MAIRSKKPIYQLLEHHLREADVPTTCVELMEIPEIRTTMVEEFGNDIRFTTDKLSNILGFMWRKNLLNKYPASGADGSYVRYAYTWSNKQEEAPRRVPSVSPTQSKTKFLIQESEDGVILEFEKFTVTIKQK